ncbi:MAG: TetR/AcrR family transcriptional regulator [Hyphomonadaceae bacterium]
MSRTPEPRKRPIAAPPHPPLRRTQASRSAATRTRILEAAAGLVRLRGFDGFATEEIAQRAGVSRGAQRHHFPTKKALVIATLEHLRDEMVARAQRRIRASRNAGKILDHVIDDALEFFFGDFFFMTTSILVSDERNGALHDAARDMMRESRVRVERAWSARLAQAGLPKALAGDILGLTLGVVRGFAVRKLILDEPVRRQQLLRVWREMAREYLRARLPAAACDAVL